MSTSWTRPLMDAPHDAATTPTRRSRPLTTRVVGRTRDGAGWDEVVALLKAEMRVPMVALATLRRALDTGDLSSELAGRLRLHTTALADRLSLLLEDLDLVDSWGGHGPVLDLQELDLAEQVGLAADLFPELLVYVEAAPGVCVHADPLRLQQLLANLIHSARRGGGRPVCLSVSLLDSFATLRLLGVAPEGGYELDIVRRLVEAHGGRLRHHPAEGSVTVTLRRVMTPGTV
jgi:signal transduction histidine kinase